MSRSAIRLTVYCLLFLSNVTAPNNQPPQMTIAIVIDQFAYAYLYKIRPYLTGGLKMLLDNGISYENAHHANAMPETAVGHAALSTGTFASDHGIIANSWYDTNGNIVEADDDDVKTAAVFKQGSQTHSYGKGPKLLMTEGLSDSFVLQSKEQEPYLAFAFSIKSRAAIMCASKLGKAIWFDKETGLFTSSKAYYKELPSWLDAFNKARKIPALKTVRWDLALNRQTGAYNFPNIENYTFSPEKEGMAGKTLPVPDGKIHEATSNHAAGSTAEAEENPQAKDAFAHFYLNPMSNQYLLDLAKTCIKEYLNKATHLLVWISLSSLDLIGHRYGPDSLEAIDTIYHIDKQLKPFIQYAIKATDNKTLFVLTADHGILPMQGVMRTEGINTAIKLEPDLIMSKMNTLIKEKHGLDGFIVNFQMPQFYYNSLVTKDIDQATLKAINKELKSFLHDTPGVKNVWTDHDLDTFSFDPIREEIPFYYKNQRYPNRSGNLFVQLQPYTLMSKYKKGTTHESPYNYDTHVPLVIYQPGVHENVSVVQKVYATQLANTLAQMLDIRKPPASTTQVLPEVFDESLQVPKRPRKSAVTITPSVVKKQEQARAA